MDNIPKGQSFLQPDLHKVSDVTNLGLKSKIFVLAKSG